MYREIIENSDSLVTVVDNEGRFIFVNRRIENMLGYNREELIGSSAFDIIHPSDRIKTETLFRQWVRDKLQSITYENRLVGRNGEVRELLWTINIHYNHDNSIRLISSIARDIGELRDTQRRLQHHLHFEKLIIDISLRFINEPHENLSREITAAIKRITQFLKADRGVIYRFDQKREKLVMNYYWSESEIEDRDRIFPEISESIYHYWVTNLMQFREVTVRSMDELPRDAKAERGYCENQHVNSFIGIPLNYDGKLEGFFGLAYEEDGQKWDRYDISLLHVAASVFIGSMMQREYEEALEQSREHYFSLYNAMGEAVAIHQFIRDEKGRINDFIITEVNRQYEANTGLRKSEVEGKSAAALFGESPFLQKYIDVVRTGEPTSFTSYFKPLKKYFRVSAFSLGHDKFGTAFSDITAETENHQRLESALEQNRTLKKQLEADNLYLREEINLEHNFEEIISTSESFLKVLGHVEEVAKTRASVLIQGETGTGKELIARAIHSVSSRSKRPMVKLNCAAIPESLIESELFGHEKGAFTGAVERKAGRFELADGSTLFLDEVAELPLQLQPKLLRVLQDGEFERIGGVKTLKVDVRIVAATNREIEKEVEQGRFRRDLYYRLNVFPINVPPLRHRKEDIPVLVRYFTEKYARKTSKNITVIPSSIISALENYDWPGNVRELENIIERSVILSRGNKLEIGNWFPEKVIHERRKKFAPLQDVEKEYIIKVLKYCKWRVSGKNGAAEILDLKPTTLEARMKKLGIRRH